MAFAGLVYLSLWLCQRFDIRLGASSGIEEGEGQVRLGDDGREEPQARPPVGRPTQPVYLLFLPLTPLGLAIFIAGTRYFDFRNHGVDVVAGSAVGTVTAWFGSRWCSQGHD